MAVIDLLVMVNILKKNSDKNDLNVRWELIDFQDKKYLYLCMDRLSLDRQRILEKKLIKQPLSFTKVFQ